MARCYVRSGVWGWPIQEQERALAEAGVWEPDRAYRDALPTRNAKMPARIKPEWLTDREAMLRPTGRRGGVTIHIATMTALAVSEADLVRVLAAAAARDATIVAVDSGVSVAPDAGAAGIADAVADWQRAKLTARGSKAGRLAGNVAASEAKKRRTLARLLEARKLWPLPSAEMPSEEIAARVGLSLKTLYTYLGRREVAQRRSKRKK